MTITAMSITKDFPGAPGTLWTDAERDEWVYCEDGKMRLVRHNSMPPAEVERFPPVTRTLPAPEGTCCQCRTAPAVYTNFCGQQFCGPCANGDTPKPPNLLVDLAEVLNRHSAEKASDTPDHVLATFLIDCMGAFNAAVRTRDSLRAHAAPGVLR